MKVRMAFRSSVKASLRCEWALRIEIYKGFEAQASRSRRRKASGTYSPKHILGLFGEKKFRFSDQASAKYSKTQCSSKPDSISPLFARGSKRTSQAGAVCLFQDRHSFKIRLPSFFKRENLFEALASLSNEFDLLSYAAI